LDKRPAITQVVPLLYGQEADRPGRDEGEGGVWCHRVAKGVVQWGLRFLVAAAALVLVLVLVLAR
jgi:hypothetical protein